MLCVMAPLDVRTMRAAALAMHGTHDWSAFRSNKCEARSPVRTLEEVAVIEEASLTHPIFPTCHALGSFFFSVPLTRTVFSISRPLMLSEV